MSDQITTGTTQLWTTPSNGTFTIVNPTGISPMQYCQPPIETYAWSGFSFLLYAVGIFVIVGAACLAAAAYKDYNNKNPVVVKKR
jgi:hypothetical protein